MSSTTERAGVSQPHTGSRHRTTPRVLPLTVGFGSVHSGFPSALQHCCSICTKDLTGDKGSFWHGPQHRARAPCCRQQDRVHRQHCLSSPSSASRVGFSGFARHRHSGGEAEAPWAAELRGCLPKLGSTGSKSAFPSPGVPCLSRILLYSSA